MEPAISIIVSTYNGAPKLPLLLEALSRQTFSDFELVVVVDGSTDNTAQLLENWANRFRLKVILQENSGRSKVRNRGATEAMGEILVFYDDDMTPETNSVSRHRMIHANQMGIIVSGSQMELNETLKTDIQNYKAYLTERWVSKYSDGVTQMDSTNLFFTAANCSVRKKVFDELGGFNEQLTDAEDFDFAKRAMANGIAVYFDKDNVAIHRDYITARKYVLRLRQYQAAHKKLATLTGTQRVKSERKFLKTWIYWFFASRFWITMIDKELLVFLPKSVRYRLYDVILHALSVEYPDAEI